MSKKQLSAEDLVERSQRIQNIPSVMPLDEMREETARYFQQLTDVKLRSLREPQWGIYIAESSKVIRRALDALSLIHI